MNKNETKVQQREDLAEESQKIQKVTEEISQRSNNLANKSGFYLIHLSINV